MFKVALEWFAREVLAPLLKYLLREVLIEFGKFLWEKFREVLRRMREEDRKAATSDDERRDVEAKYDRREADLDRIAREAPEEIDRIVARAMERWEIERQRLQANGPEQALPPPSEKGSAT